MSRRASLPGADELFRRTAEPSPRAPSRHEDKTPSRSVDEATGVGEGAVKRAPRHDQKVTFYCTSRDLVGLEQARLSLRADHGIAADRGRIVRAALSYILDDFTARGEDSVLVRQLAGGR